MTKSNFHRLFLIAAAAVVTASSAFAQIDLQLRVRQLPGWDARAREGRCEIRVWVDNRAEVRMRGDAVFVKTLEGSRGRDEGSECSHPLPYNSVRDFQIRQIAGRSRVTVAQEPNRMNNYTAMMLIDDRQGGGDNYAFEVTWRAEPNIETASAPFFDDVRACQDVVRQSFQKRNGRGTYIDFNGFADRLDQNRGRGQNGNPRWSQNQGRESIQGLGSARGRFESRDLTYSCVMDPRRNQVLSGVYQYSSNGFRTNDRLNDRQRLK